MEISLRCRAVSSGNVNHIILTGELPRLCYTYCLQELRADAAGLARNIEIRMGKVFWHHPSSGVMSHGSSKASANDIFERTAEPHSKSAVAIVRQSPIFSRS